MKSKAEEKLDKAFERIGVKPLIYHFTDVYLFRGVTVATDNHKYTWKDIKKYIEDDAWESRIVSEYGRATHLIKKLQVKYDLYGVAICDKRDNFSRQEGRNRARGRLLQHLLKEERKCKNEN